jgi:hypothetical protein
LASPQRSTRSATSLFTLQKKISMTAVSSIQQIRGHRLIVIAHRRACESLPGSRFQAVACIKRITRLRLTLLRCSIRSS